MLPILAEQVVTQGNLALQYQRTALEKGVREQIEHHI
jgi:hypothetical protein